MPKVDQSSLAATQVSFTHRRKNDASELRTFFGSEVTFGAAVDKVRFPTSIKQTAVVDADPYLNDPIDKILRASTDRAVNEAEFIRTECRERHCFALATWQGTRRRNRSQTGRKPADTCTATFIGGVDIRLASCSA